MEGARLWFPDPVETARLLRLTAEAERRNRIDTGRAVESNRWVHHDLQPTPDVGLPQAVLGPQDARETFPCGTSPRSGTPSGCSPGLLRRHPSSLC
ncbi:hypothetical protein ACIRG4_04735 [Streptomyces sp. NPDC102395]|uniref:hypothetical protein n=1 Tax=Streptomyces sp. NPDC102395 TaxID=3366168 RepID=UPI0037FCA5B8